MRLREGHKCSFKHVKFAFFTFGGDLWVTFAVFHALDAVAHEISWVGPESMVIKPTEYKKLVEQHGFKSICYVDFPSREEALKILCGFDF
ncbi:hypothetical protein DY000_02033513 [Brassica cretica]|uniref:Uncharacterized protein n=1 Tax=Brassica cretica TaxID=69181 RepID=A0ABQ7DYR9_BRACR|nr:hypothetical protein DY000_02033513 [Brassica cretica]